MNVSLIEAIALAVLPVVLAITLHEAAHGYVARQFGDSTAWMLGRVTLNPLKHIDPVGTVLVPFAIAVAAPAADSCSAGRSRYRSTSATFATRSATCCGSRPRGRAPTCYGGLLGAVVGFARRRRFRERRAAVHGQRRSRDQRRA
jgi:hypothetical protein